MGQKNVFLALSLGVLVTFSATAHAYRWFVPWDFETIEEAMGSDWVKDGDRLIIGPGNHRGAVLTKAVHIVGMPGAVIDSGPVLVEGHPCLGDMEIGFQLGFEGDHAGSGSSIKNLVFENVAFPVFGRAVDNIRVIRNVMKGAVQGITNSSGKNWTIKHNKIENLKTANGGGIGIFIGDKTAREGGVLQNRAAYNTITGTLEVSSCDQGGYQASAIGLSVNFQTGDGAESLSQNLIAFNHIDIVSDTPNVIDTAGITLVDTRNDGTLEPVVFDNLIMFNDLSKLKTPFLYSPLELEDENTVFFNRLPPETADTWQKADESNAPRRTVSTAASIPSILNVYQ